MTPTPLNVFAPHCSAERTSPIWQRIANPQKPHHQKMRALIKEMWDIYEEHAESNFLSGLQGEQFSHRWWEMYFWSKLFALGLSPKHPGEGMPDAKTYWKGNPLYFECVSPTPGAGENEIPKSRNGEIYTVPRDKITLRITSVIADKLAQAHRRQSRIGRCHYVIAIDTSQLRDAAHDEKLCIGSVYPLGNLSITLSKEGAIDDISHQYRPQINKKNNDRGEPIKTDIFLNDSVFSTISAVLFCDANIGNIAEGATPDMTVVHNYRAAMPISRKIFRSERQWIWDGKDSLIRVS